MNWTGEFVAFVNDKMEESQVPAVAFGLQESGTPIYVKGFGYSGVEVGSEAPTEDTIFGIGSITKSVTAVAIMQLQERGLLKVTDCVNQYIPEFRLPGNKEASHVTIHHLLTHSSGMPPLPFLFGVLKNSLEADESVRENEELWNIVQGVAAINTCDELILAIAAHEVDLLGVPGECFSYSNDGYAMLGVIVERVSGQSYHAFVAENILDPAGMTSSLFKPQFPPDANVATLHTKQNTEGKPEVHPAPLWWELPAQTAAGELKSTVRDMLRYAEIFRTGGEVHGRRVLSKESVEQMIQPYIEAAPGRFYGYGLMITPNFYGGTLVEHGGSLKGVQAHMGIVPEKGLTSVALTNLQGAPAQSISIGLLQAELGGVIGEEVWTYERTDSFSIPLESFVGTYAGGEGNVAITLEDGGLVIHQGGDSHRMDRVGETLFLITMRGSEEPVRFWLDDSGSPRAVTMHFRMVLKEASVASQA